MSAPVSAPAGQATATAFRVLAAISFCHFLNDTLQSIIPAVYPILKDAYHLDFSQIGLITLTVNFTASLLQPVVGFFTDSRPTPYSLPAGMTLSLFGTLLLAAAPSFGMVLIASIGLWTALFSRDFSIEYVASQISATMPNVYVFTAFWSGQAGSLLFWALGLSLGRALAVCATQGTQEN